MTDHSVVPEASTLQVLVEGIADQDGAFQDDATVTVETLRRRGSGSNIAGVTLPLTCVYIPGSDGDYQALIEATADLEANRWYRARIRAVLSSGAVRTWTEDIRVTRGAA